MKTILFAAAVAMAPTAVYAAAPMSATTYVMKAGAADQYEIQSSRLMLQSTHDAAIRRFANRMITDHTASTAQVKQAAMSAGMHPAAPMLDATGRRNMAALRATHGTARDHLYISQQKTAHQKALALHQAYAADGSVPSLKSAASGIVPVVQSHIDMLSSM